jgi:hypothetical protein
MIRAPLVTTLAVGLCVGCWEPEYTAEEINARGPAPVQTGAPADGCISHWHYSDDVELKIDFESMVTSADGFRLREMVGYVNSGRVTPALFIRAGHDDLSTRSLLLVVRGGTAGHIGLNWWGCLDVSTRRGIRFWAKGTSPSSVQPRPAKAPPEGECVPQLAIDLTEDWRMYEYTWDNFCPSGTEPAFAQRLVGIQFVIRHTLDEPWIAIDDVSFID